MAEVMVVPRETFIRTPSFRIIAGLVSNLSKESHQEEFSTFSSKAESYIKAMFSQKFSRLLYLFSFFDPFDGVKALQESGVTKEEDIVAMEMEFLEGLVELLEKSSFRMLSREQYKLATSSQFLLQIPVDVNQKRIDSSLLERFLLENDTPGLPDFARHYLIATRGVGVATESGLFVTEKFNIFLKNLYSRSLGKFFSSLSDNRDALLAKVKVAAKRDRIGAKPEGGMAGISPAQGATPIPPPPPPLSLETPEVCDVERVRLENLPLESLDWFKPVTIKEPTFENVLVLYRPALPADLRKKASRRKQLLSAAEEEKEKAQELRRLRHRPIDIRQFGNIPMADLEIVFPEKKFPNLTPMDWVSILVTAVVGLVALVTAFEEKLLSPAVIQAAAVALLSYIGRIYTNFQQAQQKYHMALSDLVYSRQLDSGRGTLLNLFQQVIDQELKETLIAYYILLTEGKASVGELDEKCEDLLADEFKENVDFDVKDACQKLQMLGIISLGADGRFTAVPMRRACEILGTTTEEVVNDVLNLQG